MTKLTLFKTYGQYSYRTRPLISLEIPESLSDLSDKFLSVKCSLLTEQHTVPTILNDLLDCLKLYDQESDKHHLDLSDEHAKLIEEAVSTAHATACDFIKSSKDTTLIKEVIRKLKLIHDFYGLTMLSADQYKPPVFRCA